MFHKLLIIFFISFIAVCPVVAQDIILELQMPGRMFSSGMPFKLDLHIQNNGPDYDDCQLFVALNLGSDDFWFYPSWCHYPEEMAWETVSISESDDYVKSIIPEFEWPKGVGDFEGARFLACVTSGNELISNLAEIGFGWFEEPPPTPTPTLTPTPLNFVYIPPGTARIGSPISETCRSYDEGPVHPVTITHGFYIQVTEVTQRQWVDIFGQNPSDHENCMNCPVEEVTWYDCCIYCNRLSIAEGLEPCYYSDESFTVVFDRKPPVSIDRPVYWKSSANGYRLPTEAEWEYACRAGTESSYNNGQNIMSCREDITLEPLAWYEYNSNTGDRYETHPVKLKEPNAWGLYDMHGNVWEWCWDLYGEDYYRMSPSVDPTGPPFGPTRVKRGGSWNSYAEYCRSATRSSHVPYNRSFNLGFRPIRQVDE